MTGHKPNPETDMEALARARSHAKWDGDAAAIAWAQNRIAKLEAALESVRSYAQHNGMFVDGLSKRQMMADVEDIARKGLGLPKAKRVKFS